MNDAVVLATRDAIIVGFNKAAEELFGWKRSEVIGKNVKVLMPANMAARHDYYVEKYHITKERRLIGVRRILDALHKNGTVFQGSQSSRLFAICTLSNTGCICLVEISLGELKGSSFIATFRPHKPLQPSSDSGDSPSREEMVQLHERMKRLETENQMLRGELDVYDDLPYNCISIG